MSSASDTFPTIQTERCQLRKIVASDQQKIFEGLSNPELIKYYGVSYQSYEATSAQMDFYNDLLSNETGIWWAICQRQTSEFIGACGFNNWMKEHRRAEIGFWLLQPFQQKGYMIEAVKEILRFGFKNMQLHRVEAIVEGGNENSSKLLKKLGFDYEGTHKECEIKNGRFINLDYYALLGRKVDTDTGSTSE
jgi:[ribosomal protein S5]-alanine N-acetyltransferase